MMSGSFLESLSDDELQQVLKAGSIPPDFVNQEIRRRSVLRTASEGANMAPEQFLGLGASQNGGL